MFFRAQKFVVPNLAQTESGATVPMGIPKACTARLTQWRGARKAPNYMKLSRKEIMLCSKMAASKHDVVDIDFDKDRLSEGVSDEASRVAQKWL